MTTTGTYSSAAANGRRLKLGIIANEFFDASVGRFGGFGWATRQVALFFSANPELGVDVVFLARQDIPGTNDQLLEVHGTRLIPKMKNRVKYWRTVYAEKIDLLLCIDYRSNYYPVLKALPRTPVVIWARDPRTPEDSSRLLTTRIPGKGEHVSASVQSASQLSVRHLARWSRILFKRPVLFATPSRYLAHKIKSTYDVYPQQVEVLPNIIDIDPGAIQKSAKPSVVFLGRVDPVKRPWIFSELARRFPNVDFIVCGKAHVDGKDGWQPDNLSPNVRFTGHVDGNEKLRLLSEAWALINTSMHEGLAVSFQEALRCETPLIATVDPQGVVSAFGFYAGYWEGTGLDSLPRFEAALRALIDDPALRNRLGVAGREWVQRTHTAANFYKAFRTLCIRSGARNAEVLGEYSES